MMKIGLLLVSLTLPLQAAIVVNLPGASENATWILNSANYPSASYNSFGTAATPWAAPATPTAATASALLNKISGSGYMSGAGFMYTTQASGGFRVYDDAPLANLETIVFQGSISDFFNAGPVLNYNGGSQALMADFSMILAATPYSDRAWQWDLSAIAEPIANYEIVFSGHFAAASLRLNQGDQFQQIIPEPSSLLLSLAGLGLSFTRRRHAVHF
ncbi:MAG: PEP-CTERM sorting domain-containing protein [Verrucomicrobia bacterium]|nr:MAG: PEP-CTERM sorting domain-containing protein [Verrucomicrobiota bacterium]